MSRKVNLFRVGKDTDPKKLAYAIVAGIKNGELIQLVAIGMQALHTAVKAAAFARGILLGGGIELFLTPYFKTIDFPSGETKTAIVLGCIHAPIMMEEGAGEANA